MQKKSTLLVSSLISLAFITACGTGGGGSPTSTFSTPIPAVSASDFNKNANISAVTNPENKSTEPLTKELRPNPLQQFNSYQKILRAIDLRDFDYAYKEYEAGGLKLAAIKGENEFGDYALNYSIVSLIQNIGQIGVSDRNLNNIDPKERVNVLKAILKHVFIYSVRGTLNRLVENDKTGISKDDKYGLDFAKDASTYFYGTDNATVSDNSIAKMAQGIDNDSKLKIKLFDTISSGLSKAQANAKDNSKDLIDAKNQVEKGLIKMLYILTLQNLSNAAISKDYYDLVNTEFSYMGIRKSAQSSDNIITTKVESFLGNKRFELLNYPDFQKNINLGFQEKALDEMKTAISLIDKDSNSAQNKAIAAQMYLDITNCAYENSKFIRNPDLNLVNNTQSFINAIQLKNKTSANSFLSKVSDYIYLGK
ncbi:MAG: hypothetical protein H7263_14580 [Candidatus Sericytochromatia bacterium]|nr:hypothetical protein [Candidatus Sericytochromatia bacterium]